MDEFTITATIANRQYKLTIERKNEEYVRGAIKTIENKIKEYSSMYSYKDFQDLLAMIALEFTTLALNYSDTNRKNDNLLEERLNTINEILSIP